MFYLLDIDECYEKAHLCAFRCENTRGSFRCVCPTGYRLSSDGTHCEGWNSIVLIIELDDTLEKIYKLHYHKPAENIYFLIKVIIFKENFNFLCLCF